jgi:hypothetical protein
VLETLAENVKLIFAQFPLIVTPAFPVSISKCCGKRSDEEGNVGWRRRSVHADPGGGWDWRSETRPLDTYSPVKSLGCVTLRRCGHTVRKLVRL